MQRTIYGITYRIIVIGAFVMHYVSLAFDDDKEIRRSRRANYEFWCAPTTFASLTSIFQKPLDGINLAFLRFDGNTVIWRVIAQLI